MQECAQTQHTKPKTWEVDINKATPMMKQFLAIKMQNQGSVLLYRMGDFYETFFEDAITTSEALEITLTSRDGGALGKIPMAGIPCKALEAYIPKLLEKGFKVAICEQVEDPSLAKGLVERKVTRILTAGTINEPYLLNAKQNNYLAAIIQDNKNTQSYGLAYVDVSTGDFKITEINETSLLIELNRINPSEILIPSKKVKTDEFQILPKEIPNLMDKLSKEITSRFTYTLRPQESFNLAKSIENIKRTFNVKSIESFGCDHLKTATMAVGSIINYLEETQLQLMPSFDVITPYSTSKYLSMDNTTRRNLELTKTVRDGAYYGSLLWAIDKTKTPMGSRLIREWIEQPVQDAKEINYRLNTVEEFIENTKLSCNLLEQLTRFNDLERISSRITNNTANAREIVSLKESLLKLPEIAKVVQESKSPFLQTLSYIPESVNKVALMIENTLLTEPSAGLKDGNLIKDGYNSDLDEYRELLNGGINWINKFEQDEKARTGIKSLKVNYNKNFGYYIEITHANSNLVPENYTRKQTLVNAERYITPELKDYETKVLNAQSRVNDLEYQIFVDLRENIKNTMPTIRSISKGLAVIDVLLSFSQVAVEFNYVKPIIDDSDILEIINGRHPVIEQLLPFGSYVSNNINLQTNNTNSESPQIMILTGPNMAGKSTYMRQIALIVLLAQIGSYVPADSARIGTVDSIFTRVGAVDDLSTGQSTFMVEMNETALILNSATPKSLILLDEIGRGTSTFDGVAIAWSVTEYIADKICAKTIFATHYHELNVLEQIFPNVENYRITIDEKEDEIQFLYKVIPGGASRSYGIQVAKMAGMPKMVINRATILMNRLLKEDSASINSKKKVTIEIESPQLSLFNG